MKKVYKYQVERVSEITLNEDAKCVLFGLDYRGLQCVWFEFDDQKKAVTRSFVVVGTGEDVAGTHLMSYINNGLVWHLYEMR